MIRAVVAVLVSSTLLAETRPVPLDPAAMKATVVKLERAQYKGRASVRATDNAPPDYQSDSRVALVPGVEFQDGAIEIDMAGDVVPGATEGARGFVGLAFHVTPGDANFEAFYLRPLNGRAEDQLQRNHSVQYISSPEFPWQRLRSETPGKYESYVDLQRGEWNHVRIEVQGVKARLYVNHSGQPVLVVNDLKHGASKGGLALWVGPGTVAHFANLRVTQ